MRVRKIGTFFGAGLLLAATALAGDGFTEDTLDQVKARVGARRAVLVDVREQREWDQGHLAGAVLIPLSRLAAWERDGIGKADSEWLARTLPKGSTLYCHCAFGGRAVPASEVLRGLKYDARPLRQGYEQLLGAGFPKATTPR